MSILSQTSFFDLMSLAFNCPDKTLRYGDDENQFAEGWSSSVNSADTLVMIHGGCWLADYDLAHVRPLCSAIVDIGMNVWSLEYRRIGNSGGGWPGTFEDIIAGVQAINKAIQPGDGRLMIAGHSAGGHLALWASTCFPATTKIPKGDSVTIYRTIGLAAISDLITYAGGNSPCELATASLLGGLPEQIPLRYQKTSPILLPVSRGTTMIHGIDDQIVSSNQSKQFSAKTGAPLVEIKGAGHFDLLNPESVTFPYLSEVLTGS